MKETISTYDFIYDGCRFRDIAVNISRHCNLTPSDEITIKKGYLKAFAGLTFPKVVYTHHLDLCSSINTSEVFPDLKIVNFFEGGRGEVDDFGYIIKINNFKGMQQYLDRDRKYLYYVKSGCEPLGDDMYRFTSRKGTWDIKVNSYD